MRWFVLFALTAALWAQDSKFDVQTRLVLVPVSVTDAQGTVVEGLEAPDFIVIDNGRPQTTTADAAGSGETPIALVVAIQTSGISSAALEKVRKIGAMIQPVVTGSHGSTAVVAFDEGIHWLTEFTANEDQLTQAFDHVSPGEPKAARMLDAVNEGVDRLRLRPKTRRVLLLISETRDRGSDVELTDAVLAAQNAGVTLYAVTYSAVKTAFTSRLPVVIGPLSKTNVQRPTEIFGTVSGGPPRCGPLGCPDVPLPPPDQRVDLKGALNEVVRLGKTNTVEALAVGTGGTTFAFTKLKGLEEALQKLGDDLHSQYLLSFSPDDAAAGYHKLDVQVAGRKVQVRARPGYWSTPAPTTTPEGVKPVR